MTLKLSQRTSPCSQPYKPITKTLIYLSPAHVFGLFTPLTFGLLKSPKKRVSPRFAIVIGYKTLKWLSICDILYTYSLILFFFLFLLLLLKKAKNWKRTTCVDSIYLIKKMMTLIFSFDFSFSILKFRFRKWHRNKTTICSSKTIILRYILSLFKKVRIQL